MGRELIREVLLSRGFVGYINEEDWSLVEGYTWHAKPHGTTIYPQTSYKKPDGSWTKKKMHQIIMGSREGYEVDHIDRNGLNNTRANLRWVTRTENIWNRGMHKSNTSGYKGVSYNKSREKYSAYITVEGKRKHLGYFTSVENAAEARHTAEKERSGNKNLQEDGYH